MQYNRYSNGNEQGSKDFSMLQLDIATCYFKDPSLYKPNEPYGVMVSLLLRYSVSGKNPHDDVPDVFQTSQ